MRTGLSARGDDILAAPRRRPLAALDRPRAPPPRRDLRRPPPRRSGVGPAPSRGSRSRALLDRARALGTPTFALRSPRLHLGLDLAPALPARRPAPVPRPLSAR